MSTKKDIIIFGGGISGLTTAHYLALTQNFNIHLYEKDIIIGGMARSTLIKDIPSEHSWRGYAPFYYNTFNLMNYIPDIKNNNNNNNNKKYITIEEISKHITKESLWTYFENNVYDVTKFISIHPGGNVILKAGGKDLKKVWEENGVLWHNKDSIIKMLNKYKIGELNNNSDNTTISNTPNTVINNINKDGIKFHLFKNDKEIENKISFTDYPNFIYLLLKYSFSDNRKEIYNQTQFINILNNNFSEHTRNVLIDHISGPGIGFDKNMMSYGHFMKVIEENLFKGKWNTSKKPTNQAWFDPWKIYLEKLGVKFYLNKGLKKIYTEQDKIIYCELEDGTQIKGDEYIMAINPFEFEEILNNSNLLLMGKEYANINIINNQISFRIGFNKKINFPEQNIAFVLIDSKNNITFYPQEYSFNSDISLGKDIKSLWSGTCVNSHDLMTKNLEQIKSEILKQMFESIAFNDYLKNNLNDINKDNIIHFEIFEDWYYDKKDKILKSKNKKWVNTYTNAKFIPDQKTSFNNLYVTGAHTKTSLNIWSMEAAVESGILANNLIRQKYNLQTIEFYDHSSKLIFKPFQIIDNVLYNFKLPNILDVIITFIILFIAYKIYNKFLIKFLIK